MMSKTLNITEFPRKVLFWGNDNLVASMKVAIENTKTGEKENAAFTTIMKVNRGKPYRNKEGKKTIDMKIKKWSSKGYSELLGKTVEYRMSKTKQTDKSYVVADTKEADYPATLTFTALFDIFVDNEKVVSASQGTAESTVLHKIPPDGDDILTIVKSDSFGDIVLVGSNCASRFLITGRQKLLIRTGRLFRLIPEYYTTYLDI